MDFEEQTQGVTLVGVTNKRAHSGTYSLQARGSLGYSYSFCPIGAEANLAGKSLAAWVYVESTGHSFDNGVTFRLAFSSAQKPIDTPVTLDKWVNVSATAEQNPTGSTGVSVTCWPNDVDFYIDDLSIR